MKRLFQGAPLVYGNGTAYIRRPISRACVNIISILSRSDLMGPRPKLAAKGLPTIIRKIDARG